MIQHSKNKEALDWMLNKKQQTRKTKISIYKRKKPLINKKTKYVFNEATPQQHFQQQRSIYSAVSPKDDRLHRIVVVGGGAGGCELVTNLGNTLGRQAGTLDSYEDQLNYFNHASLHSYEFHQGELTHINKDEKRITLAPLKQFIPPDNGVHQSFEIQEVAPERYLYYDTLVVAIGSITNDFGTKGVKEHAFHLDDRESSDRFQKKFFSCYLEAQARALVLSGGHDLDVDINVNNKHDLSITIIGSGATGVELCGELVYAVNNFKKMGISHAIAPNDVHINLVEASPRILPQLLPAVSEPAHQQLEKMGVKVYTNAKVINVEENAVCFEDGTKLPSRLTVWSAGIKAPDFLKVNAPGLETHPRSNQLMLRSTLQTTNDDDIFAIGDVGYVIPINCTKPVPQTAQNAHQQSNFLKKALYQRTIHLNSIQQQEKLHKMSPEEQIKYEQENKFISPEYKYHDFGALVTVSADAAFGTILNKYFVKGKVAQLMHYSLYRFHQIEIHGFWRALSWVLKDIVDRTRMPQIKLH